MTNPPSPALPFLALPLFAPMGCGATPTRVIVNVRGHSKHSFPVDRKCPWQHIDNVTPAEAGCLTVDGRNDGRRVGDHRDTARCFDVNPCEVVGDDRELQMLILRDP